MYKNILKVIGLTILLLIISIVPSMAIENVRKSSIPIFNESVIIVDDEGDGDYTSIQNALDNATVGDIIEVYSGIYNEEEIFIGTDNITLRGISYEFGAGDDFGKPVIFDITEHYSSLLISNNNTIIDGFIIDGVKSSFYVHNVKFENGKNNILANCDILNKNGSGYCIAVEYSYFIDNIKIINNNLSDGWIGIFVSGSNYYISGNRIENCEKGIESYSLINSNISNNLISDCGNGIILEYDPRFPECKNITIYNNVIKSCSGVGFIIDEIFKDILIENNEFNNNVIAIQMFEHKVPGMFYKNNFIRNIKDIIIFLEDWYITKYTFCENYWDKWNRIGPRRIINIILYPLIFPILFIPILKVVAYDLNPAKKPYNIEV